MLWICYIPVDGEECKWIINDHRSFAHNLNSWKKLKPKKNSGLYRIRIHDLYDTCAVLYQLGGYQAVTSS